MTIIIGQLFDSIQELTTIVSCAVILLSTLLCFVSSIERQDVAFKISLPFFIVPIGVVEYVLSFFVKDALKNNGWFIAIIALATIQLCILIVVRMVSGASNERK